MSTQRKRKETQEEDNGTENSECKSTVFLCKHYSWCAEGHLHIKAIDC